MADRFTPSVLDPGCGAGENALFFASRRQKEHVVARLANKGCCLQLSVSPDAVAWLSGQAWPGNVRELQNVLARAATLARGRLILMDDMKPASHATFETEPAPQPVGSLSLKDILAETERRVIVEALEQSSWNRTRAAQSLGISRRQLFDKIRAVRTASLMGMQRSRVNRSLGAFRFNPRTASATS